MIDNGKFKNKFRIKSARLQSWDYGWNGAYFITICTQNMAHYFAKITDEGMRLSHIIWATRRLREYLIQGYSFNQERFDKNAEELQQAIKLIRKAARSPQRLLIC